ncbi:MAG: hypothetical protein ACI9LV_000027 [Candidatus Nanohaloarchaea archaeon]|jgi:hypothetical protein
MRFPEKWKNRTTRLMQIMLLGMLAAGLYTRSSKIVINSALGLGVSFLPAIFERDYSFSISPFLSLWITSAVFFHALGSFGLYGAVSWWDHFTHSLSASLVAGTGYTVIRSIDLHKPDIRLPDRFMFVFILMTVVAFGVVWELFEFGLDLVATATEISMPLAQHGLSDTMKDMSFNLAGAVIAAFLGQAYLSELSEKLFKQLDNRNVS